MQANSSYQTINNFSMSNLNIYSSVKKKKNSVMEFFVNTDGPLGTLHTVIWPCGPIISLIRHFEDPAEVELHSW